MKKGFTLIELLAVIVILAVIALISTPIIIGLIDDARKEAFKNSAYGIIDAGEILYAKEMMNGTNEEVTFTYNEDGEESSPTGKKLDYNGTKPQNGQIKVNKEGQVAIAIHNGTYCAEKGYNDGEVIISDKTEAECKIPIPICQRATTLHTEICTQESNYCYAAGYVEGSEKTTTITYGSLGTSGELTSGDAFDCDVDGSGTYDADERFYYVSDLYNTTTKSFDETTAVLIYYTNTKAGVPDNTSASLKEYNLNNINNEGPVTAKENLPTTSQWTNIELKSNSRQILTERGTTITSGGALPLFDYSPYAARLITAQEINSGCGITVGSSETGELDTCNYLMENTKYSSSSMGTSAYWLETPYESFSFDVWIVRGDYRSVNNFTHAPYMSYHGVRPVIEILKSNILYWE